MSLYDDLGVAPDADAATIAKAHRDAVKKHHPDRRGGDRDKFEIIQRAAIVLRDPDKRARYDQTGETNDRPDNSLAELTQILVAAFDAALSEGSIETRDIVAAMKRFLANAKSGAQGQLHQVETQARQLRAAAKRLSFKGEGRDPLRGMLDQRIADKQRLVTEINRQLGVVDRATEMSANYVWAFETRPAYEDNPAAAYAYDQLAGRPGRYKVGPEDMPPRSFGFR